MPGVYFVLLWPDGVEEKCYSPSTVIYDYFKVGESYSLDKFLTLSEDALNRASERVRERYGYFCSAASDQLTLLKSRVDYFKKMHAQGQITILDMTH
ncbi:MAG: MSMEG_0570 family nitrogen starvation response protein [Gammaproteobacteria bacterium]|nr:MSMEG_0570 family nitrogen starvation response protein [Gammaproteobacteria bacterium]